MAVVELDPVFVRGLKLMHSRAKDSTAQLKALLDDAIAQRKGLKTSSSILADFDKAISGKSKIDEESRKRDADKRSADKLRDSSEPDIKKSKLDPLKARSKEEKDAKEKEKERIKKEKNEKEAQRQREKSEQKEKEAVNVVKVESDVVIMSDDDSTAAQVDVDDFALDLGISCVVCKQFDVSSGNQLVECQECHNLYHQDCHKPQVTEEEIGDPRFVWYCSRCTRSIKKMVAQKPVKPKPTVAVPGNTKESVSPVTKNSKTESTSSKAFRKIDPKAIVAPKESISLSSTTKPMVGLAGLAANLAKPRSDIKSSSVRKSDSKGDNKSSKSESKSGYRSDSSSKSSGRSEDKSSKSSGHFDKEKKSESGHKPSNSEKKSESGHKSSKGDSSSVKSSNSSSTSPKDRPEKKSETYRSGDTKGEKSNKSTSGEQKSGKSTSGDHRSDKSTSGDHKSDKSTSGDHRSDKSTSGDHRSDKSTSGDYRSEKSTSGDHRSDKSTSGDHRSDKSNLGDHKWEKLDSKKSQVHSELIKSELPQAKSSSSSAPSTPTPESSAFKSNLASCTSGSSNKQAVANLSMVTANKRIQMMKKKAQTKPTDKKIHIK